MTQTLVLISWSMCERSRPWWNSQLETQNLPKFSGYKNITYFHSPFRFYCFILVSLKLLWNREKNDSSKWKQNHLNWSGNKTRVHRPSGDYLVEAPFAAALTLCGKVCISPAHLTTAISPHYLLINATNPELDCWNINLLTSRVLLSAAAHFPQNLSSAFTSLQRPPLFFMLSVSPGQHFI